MTEPLREGLAPVAGDGARVLVLGSFPSERSLESGEYYANRRNQFWPLLAAVFGFDPALDYEARIAAVAEHGVALWDVVHSCRRAGSLDAKIDRKSLVVNDFGPLLAQHPGIERIFVNGLTAFELFERHVETALPAVRLPSSSGALPMTFEDKLARWREVGSGASEATGE
ncbi:DNA-deoxyinosine glycosylase [Mycolicibacterium sp. P9-64]|uniref:DNA-deoxyinosine glycosylase n=1 Tax=Mycolicibacterium sp. P9-64 TaxID=2024612 RepID=UPI0011EDEB84|nr:DNA-deoxyinosine glycosylase [Mycolicibacterium sp. P9-64]KAA0079459.1 DNA-deoxyinosine glycosylase [Mycolicibacterium sp. P9-64]